MKELGDFKKEVEVDLSNDSPLSKKLETEDIGEDTSSIAVNSVSKLPKEFSENEEVPTKEQSYDRTLTQSHDSKFQNQENSIPSDVLGNGHSKDIDNPSAAYNKIIKKKITKLPPRYPEPARQSTPKLRHYDREAIRTYIKRQKVERKNKLHEEKVAHSDAIENRKKHLQELDIKRRQLAVSSVMAPSIPKPTKVVIMAKNAIAHSTHGQWMDSPKPVFTTSSDDRSTSLEWERIPRPKVMNIKVHASYLLLI